jgi:peptidoglycan/xylan/chitin deacetylase (PgdA/CDA1 family)
MSVKGWLSLAQRTIPPARHGDLVLAYHLVGAGTDSPVDVTIEQFQRQLDCLAAAFDFASLSQALASARDGTPPGKPRAILTFDDAYANFAEVAWPILKARRIPAVLYVPVGFVRGSAPPPLRGARLPACSFAELRQLAASGVEIGSHGVNHVNLRRTSDAILSRELADSRAVLEQELGQVVSSFCYPQAKLDGRVERATACHYDNAVAAGGRRNLGRNPFRIPRFPVRRDEPRFETMIGARIWLSEAIASGIRQWRP